MERFVNVTIDLLVTSAAHLFGIFVGQTRPLVPPRPVGSLVAQDGTPPLIAQSMLHSGIERGT
jgi:hypothetical protein